MNPQFRGCLLAAFLLAACSVSAQDSSNGFWEPITDADRQLHAPLVDKDAGVEAIFWKVHVEDEYRGQDPRRLLKHYVRLKIFDEKGKETAATIDIETPNHTNIFSVSARTIKADGTIVEMKHDAVFQRDLVRAGGRKIKVTSFAVPAVEPGAIVEYRYTESHDKPDFLYQRLQFQREYPVERVTYYMKPLPAEFTSYHMSIWPFHCQPGAPKLERDGYQSVSLENVPAFHEEPKMFSEASVRPWALLFYRQDDKRDPDKYWSEVGRKHYDELKQALKANTQLKQVVAEVTAGTTGEATVSALLNYVWTHTRGFNDPGVTDADRAKVKMPKDRWRTAPEILSSGLGGADELNILFAAMAANAGLEARPVLMPSRLDILFDPKMTDEYFLDSVDMAVKIGDAWKLYDVSARRLPPGMLSWTEEGVKALLSDPKKPVFLDVPYSQPDSSLTRRTANFTLSTDGALEGDVTEVFTGHSAGDRRSDFQGESEARQLEIVKEGVVAVFAKAEVANMAVVGVDDATKPLEIRYHIKLDGYAARTAKRILLQPLYFQRGSVPMFTATTRNYDVAFPYAWKELDKISIKLPPDFVLEQPEAPAPMPFGSGSYSFSVDKTGANELGVTRELDFGTNGGLYLSKKNYPMLKSLFDEIYGHDTHAVSLTFTGTAQ
ncbi:MAG TPA: DUF3857 domain-containing protein [Bryobacteraceae bacterium]|jgi:hypothetical protein|nr:DUF3857 domain-containing protein [Bryobacteraceae bacterium]